MIFTKLLKNLRLTKYTTKTTVELTYTLYHHGNNYGGNKICDYL